MSEFKIDLTKVSGKIKPMHAVNNGPIDGGVRGVGNLLDFQKAGIPFARNHDASFCANYGGEHTVDVHRIFKNFDADENDPASYVFDPTDKCVLSTVKSGAEIFYRLGASIEHGYKQGTYPPKDFEKWARICEHIIRHYNCGWANGFELGIRYWEIWNEPDCQNADGSNPCWQGTEEEFIDLYCVAATYLKEKFPSLYIGGPAFCRRQVTPFKEKFLAEVKKRNAPLDFFSYHLYKNDPMIFAEATVANRDLLDKYGFESTATVLNEWNYVKGWLNDDFLYSVNTILGLKGASYVSAVFCTCQASPLDMLMYYDARPCAFNGLFEAYTYKPLKTYYTFLMFNQLYRLQSSVDIDFVSEDVYACCAKGENEAALFLTYFKDSDYEPKRLVHLDISGIGDGEHQISILALDTDNDCRVISQTDINSDTYTADMELPIYATYLIKITKV